MGYVEIQYNLIAVKNRGKNSLLAAGGEVQCPSSVQPQWAINSLIQDLNPSSQKKKENTSLKGVVKWFFLLVSKGS